MTNLETLIEALTTVIIRYHDSQDTPNKIVVVPNPTTEILQFKSREKARAILSASNFAETLTHIKNSLDSIYNERSHLLEWLIVQIKFLKKFKDSTEPLTPIALERYKQSIASLFFDLAQLMVTYKKSTYNVSYPPDELGGRAIPLALSGLTNNGYVSNKPCTSGVFIEEEVIKPFDLDRKYSREVMLQKAQQNCEEYQNTLIIPKLNVQLHELQAELSALKTQVSETQSAINDQLARNEVTSGKLSDSQKAVEEKTREIDTLKAKIQNLQGKQGFYGPGQGFLLFNRLHGAHPFGFNPNTIALPPCDDVQDDGTRIGLGATGVAAAEN